MACARDPVPFTAASGSVFDLGRQPDRRPTWKLQAANWLESLRVTAFVTFATFLALFMDDTRLAILPTILDNACQYISLAIMVSSTPLTAMPHPVGNYHSFFGCAILAASGT